MNTDNLYVEMDEIRERMNFLDVLLTQDLNDFKCYGKITRPEKFHEKLREWSELSSKYTALWQHKNGFIPKSPLPEYIELFGGTA